MRAGWAQVRLADREDEVEVVPSCLTPVPEDVLGAVTRLLHGAADASAEFEAEPTVYRWHFRRDGGNTVDVRLTELSGHQPGAELWSTRRPLGTLARAVVRCFDSVAHRGEDEYEREWRRTFPRHELEGLRAAWRS